MSLPVSIGSIDLQRVCLPVEFGRAGALACATIDELSPIAVVCVGEAGGARAVAVETQARNLRLARIPDNAGQTPQDEPVVPGGAETIAVTLPVSEMVEAARAAGVAAELSHDAGTFVCNDTLYLVLNHLSGTDVPAGFIHVPAGDALSQQQLVEGLLSTLEAIAVKLGTQGHFVGQGHCRT